MLISNLFDNTVLCFSNVYTKCVKSIQIYTFCVNTFAIYANMCEYA